ncbi:nucleotide-binding protein [Methanoplanus endosymbiosus]|uniref:Nucleotide-binding protein n=1 Tax=Methanoplanus endosymbiosus TaxID=33865 RepID=A0A9E7PNA6_9EURY|nr:nucleotide-binding protein [Methanoplanus endosymbiosus]UUX92036.1 nucleotide-binding protein [Methanoplanus endosymbiosus]
MKIKNTNVNISAINIGVVGFFAFFFLVYVILSGEYMSLLWGIPILAALFVIPIILSYMSASEYNDLAPIYEAEAKPVRIKMINESSIGNIVKIEGVVEKAMFKSLNRPQFHVADRSGLISVKMFTGISEDINKDDIVEVYGQVIKRYVMVGEPVINAVIIRKTEKRDAN